MTYARDIVEGRDMSLKLNVAVLLPLPPKSMKYKKHTHQVKAVWWQE